MISYDEKPLISEYMQGANRRKNFSDNKYNINVSKNSVLSDYQNIKIQRDPYNSEVYSINSRNENLVDSLYEPEPIQPTYQTSKPNRLGLRNMRRSNERRPIRFDDELDSFAGSMIQTSTDDSDTKVVHHYHHHILPNNLSPSPVVSTLPPINNLQPMNALQPVTFYNSPRPISIVPRVITPLTIQEPEPIKYIVNKPTEQIVLLKSPETQYRVIQNKNVENKRPVIIVSGDPDNEGYDYVIKSKQDDYRYVTEVSNSVEPNFTHRTYYAKKVLPGVKQAGTVTKVIRNKQNPQIIRLKPINKSNTYR